MLPPQGPSCAYTGYHDHLSGPAAASVTSRFPSDTRTLPMTLPAPRCRDSSVPYRHVCPGLRLSLSSRVFRCPAPQCRTTRQLAYSFTKVAPLCFTGCFMMLPLASTLHPWVPPPCTPGSLHLAPLGPSTLHPWGPPPCSPEFLHLPPRGSSTLLPGAAPPSSPEFLHLPPWGCSTLLPGVPPPCSPLCFTGCFMLFLGDLHLAPWGCSTFLPGVPPPSSPEFLHLAPLGPSTFLPVSLHVDCQLSCRIGCDVRK